MFNKVSFILFCCLFIFGSGLLEQGHFIETARIQQGNKTIVDFNYSNPGEYYINQTSPIYPQISVTISTDSSNELTLTITNSYDNFSIPQEYPFPYTKSDGSSPEYTFDVNNGTFFTVKRYNGEKVFEITSASVLSLLYSELHVTKLTSELFGFGERRLNSFKLTQQEFSVYNHDFGEFDYQKGYSMYGAHPVLLQRINNQYSIVLLQSSRPLTLQNTNDELIYRITGGIIGFKIFIGNTDAKSLIKQYHKFINGWELHPFWSSGWHQSRWGYKDTQVIKNVIQKYNESQIPLEVIWTDLDYMQDRKCFTLNEELYPRADIQEITNRTLINGVHWVPIVDPGIAVDSDCGRNLVQSGAYIKSNRQNSTPYLGVVWPGGVYFADFNNPDSINLWYSCHKNWFDKYQIEPSGIWIDMNELANFIDGEDNKNPKINTDVFELNDLPWDAMGSITLEGHTIAIDALHDGDGLYLKGQKYISELDFHNYNGFFEQIAQRKVQQTIQNKTLIFTLSRSSVPGSGRFASIWFGDNGSTWAWLKSSINQMFNFNIFGIPFSGDDICGFNGNTTAQLCARWIQLGAFYPFARDHNAIDQINQEPYEFEITKISAQKSIKLRYSLLKYYYLLFIQQRDSSIGAGTGTIIDPLFYQYGSEAIDIDTQFQLGNIIVNPVTEEQTDSTLNYSILYYYVPTTANWVSFEDGKSLTRGWNAITRYFTDNAFLAFETGSIIPWSNTDNVYRLRQLTSSIDLIVVLNSSGTATGKYLSIKDYDDENTILSRCWNDNASCIHQVNVRFSKDTLYFTNFKTNFSEEIIINNIKIYRNGSISSFTINVSSFSLSWEINL